MENNLESVVMEVCKYNFEKQIHFHISFPSDIA